MLKTEYKGKYSRQGWPLGVYPHSVETIATSLSGGLLRVLTQRYGRQANFRFEPFESDDRFGFVYAEGRLSMDLYHEIYSFIAGYKAASY